MGVSSDVSVILKCIKLLQNKNWFFLEHFFTSHSFSVYSQMRAEFEQVVQVHTHLISGRSSG